MKRVDVHILSVKDIKDHLDLILGMLTPDRIEKANRYIKENDRLLSLGGSYLLKKYTGDSPLKEGEFGKPYKDGMEFSLSHDGEYVIFAIADQPIGIDIEKIEPRKKDVSRLIFSDQELVNVKSEKDFYQRWCLKEAISKCVGTGLRGDIKIIPSELGAVEFQGKKIGTAISEIDGYMVAVAVQNSCDFLINITAVSF